MSVRLHGTSLEGALLFTTILENSGWQFSVDEDGRLHVVIGDSCPSRGLHQHVLLHIIGQWSIEILALLDTQRVAH